MSESVSWKTEALQLRKNYQDDSSAISAFVELFEKEGTKSPLLCLALHHVAMRFHKCAGKKTMKLMCGAQLEQLPEEIYPKDRIIKP